MLEIKTKHKNKNPKKPTVTEMKNTFKRLNSRLERPEERISQLEDMSIENPQTEK